MVIHFGQFHNLFMPGFDVVYEQATDKEWPLISILVAVRNEEHTVYGCLQAIAQLTYPPGSMEVLVGNDQSTDHTRSIICDFIADKPTFRLIDITSTVGNARGKANVLAQLASQAKGSLFFFTDADTQVPNDWLVELSGQFNNQVEIVTGVTLPEGSTLFHKLQAVDWLYNLTLTHLLSLGGIPVTAMGNNMAVSRRAYEATGGYATLPFSVVEDYTLFRAIINRGYGFRNLLTSHVLARTKPVDTPQAFLQQRKRWMSGATALPAWMVVLLYGQYLAGPLLLLLAWFSPVLAFGLYFTKLLIQTMTLSFGLSRVGQTKLWPYALLFEPYQLVIGPLSVSYYLLPVKLEWKGRTYD